MEQKWQVRLALGGLLISAASIAVGVVCCQGSSTRTTSDGGRDGGLDVSQQPDLVAGVDTTDVVPDAAIDRDSGEPADARPDGPPHVVLDPRQACQGTGNLPTENGACPVIDLRSYTSLGTGGYAYDNLPACNAPNPTGPGYTISVQLERTVPNPQVDPRLVGISYLARQKTATGDCGIHLDIIAYKMSPTLKVGDEIQVSSRIVAGTMDMDVTLTTSIRDPSGLLLFARVSGARPGRIEADLLNGLTLAVQNNVCTEGEKTMVRALFTDGATGECALDALTQRCCTMWQANYAMTLLDAFTSPPRNSGFPSPWITFELSRSGFWQAIQ